MKSQSKEKSSTIQIWKGKDHDMSHRQGLHLTNFQLKKKVIEHKHHIDKTQTSHTDKNQTQPSVKWWNTYILDKSHYTYSLDRWLFPHPKFWVGCTLRPTIVAYTIQKSLILESFSASFLNPVNSDKGEGNSVFSISYDHFPEGSRP